jgi:glycerophosphoryl diester phosphodiesterase
MKSPLGVYTALVIWLFAMGAGAAEHGNGASVIFEIDVGSRPARLVEGMDEGELKQRLRACRGNPARPADFSIGHRGAPRRYPEHTRESSEAAARQGAGILECDVTFTSDRELVCRHSQCDLHTTTNVLSIPELAAKCSKPFTPADPARGTRASARCCASDLTLEEFRMLNGRMDAFNPMATTVDEYLGDTPGAGTLMTHAESIELFKRLGVKMTPELKSPGVDMPYQGDYSQEDYAQQMIDEYRAAGVEARDVWVQSFDLDDVSYWIEHEPEFGEQAVFLDSRPYSDKRFVPSQADFERLKRIGVGTVAPPMFALLALDARGNIVPSDYAELAKAASLDIVTWTIERSDLSNGAINAEGRATFYYRTIGEAIEKDSDLYEALHVLARDVGIKGIFSDWPATVTYYANCMGLE